MSTSTAGLRLIYVEGLIRALAGMSPRQRGWSAARMSNHVGAPRDSA